MITTDARCTREIKSRIAIAKATFNSNLTFHQQIELKLKEKTSEVLQFEQNIVVC
jgi:hypothetical protein